jgi:hypothetical protein
MFVPRIPVIKFDKSFLAAESHKGSIHQAAILGDLEMLAYSVQHGLKSGKDIHDVVESKLHGMTPLHYAFVSTRRRLNLLPSLPLEPDT